jgi:hypothetical protein
MGAKGATKGAGLGETLFLQWKERVSSGKNQRRHGVTDSDVATTQNSHTSRSSCRTAALLSVAAWGAGSRGGRGPTGGPPERWRLRAHSCAPQKPAANPASVTQHRLKVQRDLPQRLLSTVLWTKARRCRTRRASGSGAQPPRARRPCNSVTGPVALLQIRGHAAASGLAAAAGPGAAAAEHIRRLISPTGAATGVAVLVGLRGLWLMLVQPSFRTQ